MKNFILFSLSLCILSGCEVKINRECPKDIIMENIFYEENVSLPTYFPLKDLHGKVWNVDSIFQQNKMVFRFTQHDCEDCIRFEANLIRNRGMSSHTVGIASYDNLRLLRLAIEKYHIDFPVYFLPFNQEKEVFASVNTIRKPFLFMMSDDLHSHYFFFPNKEQPKVSEIYYQEIRNRLSAESSQSDNIFENTSVDLGDVKIGKSKKAHFKITNQTDGLLVIKLTEL